ncbi:DNA mismatch repair endonuclease MutL [Halostella litorea]|uniref:DNA mismatch repair endonuclease MutL n=1 Tax=Halostella litorea TaxID=2528831 RepID=UPI001F012E9B|nr:DNA mismatch repair endonuclease MutL [Halostella litorea]
MSETEIRELDESTVQRIAAGEVVERPASAVKELVENSLDADASRVDVEVERGGIDGIVVSDDGVGMTEADVRAAVREHTTSKIDGLADLESGLTTLGFRGEALHTIGAVSRLTITTKPRDADDAATELRYEGGEVTDVSPAGRPPGTTVAVDDLFYNTPARRKYLKTEATEFAHVNRVVTRYALANPDVAVSLTHDGRETFSTTGRGDLRSAVLSVYGREVAEAMIEVPGDDLPAGPLDGVSGYVSHPETNRSGREYVSTFVNGRYVTADAVREAVLEAYGGQLAADRYPFVVLFLDVPPASVDVNVHPRKMEARFDDEAGLRRQVEGAVEDALLDHGLVRSSAPRGRSAPDETSVRPDDGAAAESERDGNEAADGVQTDAGDADNGHTARADAAAVDTPDGAVAPDESDPAGADAGGTRPGGTGSTVASEPTGSSDAASTGSVDANASGETTGSDAAAEAETSGTSPRTDASRAADRDDDTPESGGGRDGAEPTAAADAADKFDGPTEQRTLTGGSVDRTREYDSLPAMRVLGQFRDTYVVAETDEGLALVDQHAADERVNYERLREAFAGDTTAQSLAEPVAVELTAGEAALFDDYADALASLGFYADRAGDRAVEVTTVPAVFDETLDPEDLRDVLASFVETAEDASGRETVESLADEFIADLACYPSVTGNTSLSEGAVTDLLAALDGCENPYACPHGRPVVIELDDDELTDRFERDYPGHGGRRSG